MLRSALSVDGGTTLCGNCVDRSRFQVLLQVPSGETAVGRRFRTLPDLIQFGQKNV